MHKHEAHCWVFGMTLLQWTLYVASTEDETVTGLVGMGYCSAVKKNEALLTGLSLMMA